MERKSHSKLILLSAVLIISAGVLVFLYGKTRKADSVKESGGNESAGTITAEAKNNNQKKAETIYNVSNQKKIKEDIDKKKAQKEYTDDSMLILENPFGTNNTSLYAYFKTKEPVSVTYTVHVSNKKIKDFTRTLKNSGKNNLSAVHEYQLIGLIPGVENEVTFTFKNAEGKTYKKSIKHKMKAKTGVEELILSSKKGASKEKMADGLYVILGNDRASQDYMYYYDNNGVLRGELPLIGYRSNRILFHNNRMYHSISQTQMAEVSPLGQVTKVYSLGKYKLHHDYVFDGDHNLLILATDKTQVSVEDCIVKLDLKTGKVTEILDLETYFKDYKAKCKKNKKGDLDWMHLNTIQWMGNDQILVSARETSSIIKFSNIYKKPKLEYMLGEKTFWSGTKYSKYLFKKSGSFKSQTGQHCVTYVPDSSLKKGQYYLLIYDNNIGISVSRPDYKWSQIKGVGSSGTKGTKSYYYKYLVDENKKTYKLVDSLAVGYSGYVSSVQKIDGNLVIDSGNLFTFYEYDKKKKLIRSYYMKGETYIYRVFKHTFEDFYFA